MKQDKRNKPKVSNAFQVTRREFGAGAGAAALVAAGASLSPSAVRAAAPKRGGRVRIGVTSSGADDTLDPIAVKSSTDFSRAEQLYNGLTEFDSSMSTQPDLAKEWSVSDDGLTWKFRLQDGVEFHNGKTLTAEDVVFSMNRSLGDDSVSQGKPLVGMIKEWRAEDPTTVTAVLNTPNAELAASLATWHFKIIPAGTTAFNDGVGTGPFKVKEFTPGIGSLMERNENYWQGDGPYLDEVEVIGIGDSVARVNALISGQIEFMMDLDTKAIAQVEAADGVEVFDVPSGQLVGLNLMADRAPTDNLDLRLGIAHLLNRETFLKKVLKGYGTIGNDTPIGSTYADFCPDIEQRVLDHDRAKFHLNKAGITEIEINAAEVGQGLVEMALLLQQEGSKIGLNVKVNKVPTSGYWSTYWQNTPIHVSTWNPRPTANIMMSLGWQGGAAWNDSGINNARLDQLLIESRAVTDPALRKEMFCEMQRIIHDGASTLVPAFTSFIDAKSTKLKGIDPVPISPGGGWAWVQNAWLDA